MRGASRALAARRAPCRVCTRLRPLPSRLLSAARVPAGALLRGPGPGRGASCSRRHTRERGAPAGALGAATPSSEPTHAGPHAVCVWGRHPPSAGLGQGARRPVRGPRPPHASAPRVCHSCRKRSVTLAAGQSGQNGGVSARRVKPLTARGARPVLVGTGGLGTGSRWRRRPAGRSERHEHAFQGQWPCGTLRDRATLAARTSSPQHPDFCLKERMSDFTPKHVATSCWKR